MVGTALDGWLICFCLELLSDCAVSSLVSQESLFGTTFYQSLALNLMSWLGMGTPVIWVWGAAQGLWLMFSIQPIIYNFHMQVRMSPDSMTAFVLWSALPDKLQVVDWELKRR
jgi:hypothetical protein